MRFQLQNTPLNLFASQLWRVNQCLRCKTNKIGLWRVLWPFAFFIAAVVAILTAWTATAEYGYERKVIDQVTGESIGQCAGVDDVYLAPIYILQFIPIICTGIIAYMTLGVDDLYSEAKWVLTFILVQMQVREAVLSWKEVLIFVVENVSLTKRFLYNRYIGPASRCPPGIHSSRFEYGWQVYWPYSNHMDSANDNCRINLPSKGLDCPPHAPKRRCWRFPEQLVK